MALGSAHQRAFRFLSWSMFPQPCRPSLAPYEYCHFRQERAELRDVSLCPKDRITGAELR